MKILMVTGASKTVIWFRKELIKYLQNKGHIIYVVSCDEDNAQAIRDLGVEFCCIKGDNRDTSIFGNIKFITKLRKYIKQIEPNRVMTFQAKANTFGIIAAKLAGVKNIYAMVEGLGDVFNKNGIREKFIKFISLILYKISFRKISTVFFLNSENMKIFLSKKLVKQTQAYLIEGIGVDTHYFLESSNNITDKINFVMIARTVKEKGCIEYCEAAKQIIDSGIVNVTFHYYGDSGNAEHIIKRYNNQGFITYGGYTNDIKNVLNNCNIVVLPSYHEGVPRTILEAMSVGRAIIASDIEGCRVCVQDGINGLLVAKKSVLDLVNKMKFLINNPEQIVIMGKESRKIAEEKFDSNKINSNIYDRLLS